MSQQDQILLAIFLLLTMFVFLLLTMFGMGATLSLPDFRAVARRPRPLLLGLASQFGWMPLVLAVYTAPYTGEELTIPYANVVTTPVAILVPASAALAWGFRSARTGAPA